MAISRDLWWTLLLSVLGGKWIDLFVYPGRIRDCVAVRHLCSELAGLLDEPVG